MRKIKNDMKKCGGDIRHPKEKKKRIENEKRKMTRDSEIPGPRIMA